MNPSTPLLFTSLPAQKHSKTSRAASRSMNGHAQTDRVTVFQKLMEYPEGLTDNEIIDLTKLGPSTARPRRIDLVRSGVVIDSGRTRKTASGRAAVVWRVK